MATSIKMRNPETGLTKQGFYGFSWTTFFLACSPRFSEVIFSHLLERLSF